MCTPPYTYPDTERRATASATVFSVIMPTFNQCAFIRRAISGLMRQTHKEWELIIINDGSTDRTKEFLTGYLDDPRIRYIENPTNRGLGHALNQGLDAASYDFIAYLPSDDCFDDNHLAVMAGALQKENVILAFSGMRFDESKEEGLIDVRTCKGAIPGYCTQLVQVAHRKTDDRWTERGECVSDDLFFMFWRKLTSKGLFVPTGKTTCEWTCHPHQRHKICGERYGGGLNKYRAYYDVKDPVCFRSSKYKTFDEQACYAAYRDTASPESAENGLKILLVGELAYNPERIHALERAGHRLYGLWSKPRFGYSTVGPLPFGNVTDIPYDRWRSEVEQIKPDIIYALLSTSAIELAHEVLMARTGIPFVWHFKEGPQEAQKAGLWSKLIDLYSLADGCIYLNDEERQWMDLFIPPRPAESTLLLDGDMPPADIFSDRFSPKLSAKDGEVHTVVAGRAVGISPEMYRDFAREGIHLHVYSENRISENSILPFTSVDSVHFHVHTHCPPSRWTGEFSRYDAGWLHCIDSANGKRLQAMTWADLNLPARISTYLVAGIPMIQKRNAGHLFAQRSYLDGLGVDICFDNVPELIEKLKNRQLIREKTSNVMSVRKRFSFEAHQEELTDFFRRIICLCGTRIQG